MNATWGPVKELSEDDFKVDLSDVDSLRAVWAELRDRLTSSSPDNLKDFEERLTRKWSIETGIIERIYDIDRGITQILIERGFAANLIERSSTDRDPDQLVIILRDHQDAVELIQDCVADSRELTIGFIHELHATLMRHQCSVEAQDQFGKMVELELLRGTYKIQPNNPKRPDGQMHSYCPPEHVQAEMENLLRLYHRYEKSGYNPVLIASWFHHRFTQVHPYQDGNGRVVRALASLILIKRNLFPLVITRDHRTDYIDALEQADAGKLSLLTRLFAEIEKKTILEAVSIKPDSSRSMQIVEEVTSAIAVRLRKRREEVQSSLRKVNDVASHLRDSTDEHLERLAEAVRNQLESNGVASPFAKTMRGGPDQVAHDGKPTEHWYRHQVVSTAIEANQRANFNENHYWVRLRLIPENLPRLTYVVSFHHIGQELSGIMEATAFAEVEYPDSEDESAKIEYIRCMDKAMTFTYQDDMEALARRMEDWVSETFAIAVRAWGELM